MFFLRLSFSKWNIIWVFFGSTFGFWCKRGFGLPFFLGLFRKWPRPCGRHLEWFLQLRRCGMPCALPGDIPMSCPTRPVWNLCTWKGLLERWRAWACWFWVISEKASLGHYDVGGGLLFLQIPVCQAQPMKLKWLKYFLFLFGFMFCSPSKSLRKPFVNCFKRESSRQQQPVVAIWMSQILCHVSANRRGYGDLYAILCAATTALSAPWWWIRGGAVLVSLGEKFVVNNPCLFGF